MALYHSLELADLVSTWVVIQPSKDVQSRLRAVLRDMESEDPSLANHLSLHALLPTVLGANWRHYINDLEIQLAEMVIAHPSLQGIDQFRSNSH